jgi:hypothetical protein
LYRSGSCTRPRRHSCARSRSLQSHSPLYQYPLSELAPTVRGARITALTLVGPTAVSTHSSNAAPPCRGSADIASPIHSQPMPPRGSREGALGVTIRKQGGVGLTSSVSPQGPRSLSERALTVRGARVYGSPGRPIAVSTRSSNLAPAVSGGSNECPVIAPRRPQQLGCPLFYGLKFSNKSQAKPGKATAATNRTIHIA